MQGRSSNYKGNIPSSQLLNREEMHGSNQNLPANPSRCRICLEQNSPLLQLPCSCLGQIGLVHEKCFTQWIHSLRNNQGLRTHDQSLFHVNSDIYEIPCQICKSNIKLQMSQKTRCLKLQDLKQTDRCLSLVCILFMTAITGVICFLCISNAINSSSDVSKRIVLILVMLIFLITLGCLIKKQIGKLMISSITKLRIIPAIVSQPALQVEQQNKNKEDNDIVDFVGSEYISEENQERNKQ